MRVNHDNAIKIGLACAVLHNMSLDFADGAVDEPHLDDEDDDEEDAVIIVNNLTSKEKLERAKAERDLYRLRMRPVSDADIGRVARHRQGVLARRQERS